MTLRSSHSKSIPVSFGVLSKPPGACTGTGHSGRAKLFKAVFNMGYDKNVHGEKVPQSGLHKDRQTCI